MKMRKLLVIALVVIFLFLAFFSWGEKHLPASFFPTSFFSSPEVSSPSDWIKEEQIKVYPDRVLLEIQNPSWAAFTDTNSMDPFLDETANAIEIKPKNPEQIKAGDVISYQSSYGLVIHRVIEKGEDEEGVYYLVKGDNNSFKDPFKVRFEEVKGVVVAIIY